jgi:hypothetical protein
MQHGWRNLNESNEQAIAEPSLRSSASPMSKRLLNTLPGTPSSTHRQTLQQLPDYHAACANIALSA